MVTETEAAGMFALSFAAVLITTIIYWLVIRGQGRNFWDIIREKDWEASLPRFQLLIWTWVIVFAFLGVFLVRAFGGQFGFPALPSNLVILLGVSVAPAVISAAHNTRFGAPALAPTPRPPLANMLMETVEVKDKKSEMKPTVTRFQMFIWTFIAVTAYLVIVFGDTAKELPDVTTIALPNVPDVMLALMGVSQGAYVAGKLAKGT